MTDHLDQETGLSWESARRQLQGGLLSVVMPAHNLGASIAGNLRTVHAVFAGQIPFEIVVVDDGSTDNTDEEIQRVSRELAEVRHVLIKKNSGKGGALRRGFEVSTGSFVLFLDADLDLLPWQTALFFEVMEKERADIVIGSKRHPDSVLNYPWHRRLASNVYYFMVKLMFGLPIHDTQTGIKLFRRHALELAFPRMLVKQFAFDLELLAIAHEFGCRVAEAPVVLHFAATWGALGVSSVRSVLIDTLAIFYRSRILGYYRSIPDMKMPQPLPLVSIVIAYPARTPYLDQCLAEIAKQTYRDFEVILLPDQADAGPWPGRVRQIATGRCRPAEKRNIGIREARGGIVAFIDDDAYPAEEWIERAVIHFSSAQVAAVGGPACTPPDDPYLAAISGRIYANRLVSGSYVYRYRPNRVRHVDDYPSCNLFVRTDALGKLNGFRTDYWPGEDTYLCMELVHTMGKDIVYEPRTLAYHHRRKFPLAHLRQVGRYGLHRGYFARRYPATSRRIGYMLPSLFVAGLIFGGVASLFSVWLRHAYLGALALYAFIALMSAYSTQPLTWLLTWLGVVSTHLVYGVRFLMGLLSRQLPSEVRSFDHPSEEKQSSSGT